MNMRLPAIFPRSWSRRWRAISMMEMVVVLAIVGVAVAAAVATARGELSKMHVRQTVGDLRQLLGTVGEISVGNGSYNYLGNVGAIGNFNGVLEGASLIARTGSLPDSMVVQGSQTVASIVRIGARYPINLASGAGCTTAADPCAALGMNTGGHLYVAIGMADQPVEHLGVCQALMQFAHPALRAAVLQPAATNVASIATPVAATATTAANAAAEVLAYASGTLTGVQRLNQRGAQANFISGECGGYADSGTQGTIILVFSGFSL